MDRSTTQHSVVSSNDTVTAHLRTDSNSQKRLYRLGGRIRICVIGSALVMAVILVWNSVFFYSNSKDQFTWWQVLILLIAGGLNIWSIGTVLSQNAIQCVLLLYMLDKVKDLVQHSQPTTGATLYRAMQYLKVFKRGLEIQNRTWGVAVSPMIVLMTVSGLASLYETVADSRPSVILTIWHVFNVILFLLVLLPSMILPAALVTSSANIIRTRAVQHYTEKRCENAMSCLRKDDFKTNTRRLSSPSLSLDSFLLRSTTLSLTCKIAYVPVNLPMLYKFGYFVVAAIVLLFRVYLT